MTGNETERALACSSQWAGIYFQNGFFILFLLLPLSINIAIIIISYFLKIVELWGNSQKRNKANKMEKGRTLPERLTQWCGSGQSCWVWAEFGDTGRKKYSGAYNWTSWEMLHFNGMAPPVPPGACIDEKTLDA